MADLIFDRIAKRIRESKEVRASGRWTSIPINFGEGKIELPDIERGKAYGVLAGTGVGKSTISRFMFAYNVYKHYKDTGYRSKVLFFALEDNTERVYIRMMCHYIFEKFKIEMTPAMILSKRVELPDTYYDMILAAREFFAELESVVEVIDDCFTPNEILGRVKEYANTIGSFGFNPGEGAGKYVQTEDVHVVVLVDNFFNVEQDEEDSTERECIIRLARTVMRKIICNEYMFSFVGLLQMSFEYEKRPTDRNGKLDEQAIVPTLHSIGEVKVTARSFHVMFALYSPQRFEFKTYYGYNIERLRDMCRFLVVIKNNDGICNQKMALFYNPIRETFHRLPPSTVENIRELESWYNLAERNYNL